MVRRVLDFLDALEGRAEPSPKIPAKEKRALVRFFGVGLLWLAAVYAIILWRIAQ